jgi:hypothetical protein
MINVAAIRMQQFGVQFYQASLSASDIDKLVRFEVLSYGDAGQQPVRGGKKKAPKVNWDLLERRIASNERPISGRSSARRSTSWSTTTNSAGRRAICPRSPVPSSFRATRS